MLKNISLKNKMILGGMVAVLVPFFVAGIIIYVQLSNSLLKMAEENSVHMAGDVSDSITAALGPEIKLASAIASDPDIIGAVRSGDYLTAQTKLEAVHKRIGTKYSTIFLADQQGLVRADAVFKQQIGLNLSGRNYFSKAKKGMGSVTGPFMPKGTATRGTPIVVACAPVLEKNAFYGIIALPFNIDFILNTVLQEKVGRKGYAYLISDEGLILIHSKKEFILKFNLFDQPGTAEIKKVILSGKNGDCILPL